jgi:hypothetical protein
MYSSKLFEGLLRLEASSQAVVIAGVEGIEGVIVVAVIGQCQPPIEPIKGFLFEM